MQTTSSQAEGFGTNLVNVTLLIKMKNGKITEVTTGKSCDLNS